MPWIGEGIAFVHAPKTGGTWCESVIRDVLHGEPLRGVHDPVWTLTETERAGRMVVGTVRDPWSWYCSLWGHAEKTDHRHRELLRMYGNGSGDFRSVLYGWTHPAKVKDIPVRTGVIWAPINDGRVPLRQSGVGLATWALWYMYGAHYRWNEHHGPQLSWQVDALLDMRRLNEGMGAVIQRELPREQFPPVGTRTQRQFSPAKPYEYWYDDEMLGWVMDADAPTIREFGFAPFCSGYSAVYGMED